MSLSELPYEVLSRIFSFCDGTSLLASICVCSSWNAVGDDEERFWKPLAKEYSNALDELLVMMKMRDPKELDRLAETKISSKQHLILLSSFSVIETPGSSLDQVHRVMAYHGSLQTRRICSSLHEAVECANAVQEGTSLSTRIASTVFCLLPGPGLASIKVEGTLELTNNMMLRGSRRSSDDVAEYASRVAGSILINHQRENNFCYFDFLEFTGLAQSDCSVPILSITRGPAYFYDCTFLGSGYPDRLYKISVSDSGRFELDSCQFEKPTTPVTIKIGDGGQMNATTCGCKLWPNAVEVLEGGSLALAECNISGKHPFVVNTKCKKFDLSENKHNRLLYDEPFLTQQQYFALFDRLRTNIKDEQQVEWLLRTLTNVLLQSDSCNGQLVERQLPTVVLLALKVFPTSVPIHEAGTKALWGMGMLERNKLAMSKMHTLPAVLMEEFSTYSHNLTIQEHVLGAIGLFCESRSPGYYDATPFRQTVGSNREFMKEVLDTIKKHSEESIASSAIFMLWTLCLENTSVHHRELIFELGGLETLLMILESENTNVKSLVFGALTTIIVTQRNRDMFEQKGGLSVLNSLLHNGTMEVQINAAICIRAFCYANEHIPESFRTSGLLRKLLAIIEDNSNPDPDAISLREHAVAAIANYASGSGLFGEEKALASLFSLLRSLSSSDPDVTRLKMGTIICVCHMTSQVPKLPEAYLSEIESFWTNNMDIDDVIFSPNDVKFVTHTEEPVVLMMALWCIAYINLEEPPVGNALTWKSIADILRRFVKQLGSSARRRRIIDLAKKKLNSGFGVLL